MFNYRHTTPQDDPAILEMFRASFGKDFTQAWWDWYKKNPYGPNRYRVIEDKGQLAAGYGLLPLRLYLGGEYIDASLCQNVCTHPDHQGRGLFVDIGHAALDDERSSGARVSLGMPNSKAIRGHMKVGWDILVPLSTLYKTKLERHKHTCATVPHFAPAVNRFLDENDKKFSLVIAKNQKWLNWRYVTRPGYWNKILVVERGYDIAGYCVAKYFHEKAHILDIQASDFEAFSQLVSAVEDWASGQEELNLWTNPRDIYREWFISLGYEEREGPDNLIIHTNYGEKVVVPTGPICYSLGDNDVY